ncbi:MAG TPA: NAD(P)-dependent oxidoreductase [Aliidongia sp.]|nr:NAD(P)-dependent oxidoreductase [Aliidongia sp.]
MTGETIAVIGLGLMGAPIARRLLEAGHRLTVWNRSPDKAASLVGQGAKLAASPAEAASEADTVIVMVTDDAAVRSVVAGPGGVLEGLGAGRTIIDMSTILPATSRAMAHAAAESGIHYLDCPVSGSTDVVARGALAIFAGGDAAALDRSRALLAPLAASVSHMGPSGAGTATKLVVNGVMGIGIQAIAECLALGIGLGLDRDRLITALAGTNAVSPSQKKRLEAARTGDFTPGFTLANLLKDLGLILAASGETAVPMPALATAAHIAALAPAEARALDCAVTIRTVAGLAPH